MGKYAYRERDYGFGRTMLTLRSAMELTQEEEGKLLEVTRHAVVAWEKGIKYPNVHHLKLFITLALERRAFPAGQEAEAVRKLWSAAKHEVLLDETWLHTLLKRQSPTPVAPSAPAITQSCLQGASPPFPLDPLVGRDDALTAINKRLKNPACQLLTLLGPGGVGKTRLALEVARIQSDTFGGAVAFVELAAETTAGELVWAIAESLKVPLTDDSDLTANLLNYLHQRQLLLILDNFEQLLGGVEVIQQIVRAAPQVKLLITTRERLNLHTEWLYDVSGLTYPAVDAPELSTLDSTALVRFEAVQLFLQRAAQTTREPFSEPDILNIAYICQHVAGLPLALELAAAAVRTYSVSELEQRLRSSLDTLNTVMHDAPERHRSMRAAFDHSWNLLSVPERTLLSRLSVFHGFSLDAAERVTGGTPQDLTVLVDKSLVGRAESRTHPAENATEARFTLLLPIREYAFEKLTERGEADALADSHVAYYLGLAEAMASRLAPVEVTSAVRLLGREHDNLRAALSWTLTRQDIVTGLNLGGALGRFWRSAGYISEGRRWLAELLAAKGAAEDLESIQARSRATAEAAWLATDQHDFTEAEHFLEESIALRRKLGKAEGEINLLYNAALQNRAVGQYRQAVWLLENALSKPIPAERESLNTVGLGHSFYGLALVRREQGDFTDATTLFEVCVRHYRNLGDREGMNLGLLGLGDVARDQGDTNLTRVYGEQTLASFRELGTQWAIGFALNNLAQAALQETDLPTASGYAHQSITLFRKQNAEGGLAEALVTQGHISRVQGDMSSALGVFAESLQLSWRVGPRLMVGAALEGLACVLAPTQPQLALKFLSTAAALRARMRTPVRPVDQPAVAKALETSQTAINEGAFRAAWLFGERHSLEQIVRTASHIPMTLLAGSSGQGDCPENAILSLPN